jgi:hypothetical protein
MKPPRHTWMSKDPPHGAAHAILGDGSSACAALTLLDGRRMLHPFFCTFVPLRERDHLCTLCRRLFPRACKCGRCGIAPVARKAVTS